MKYNRIQIVCIALAIVIVIFLFIKLITAGELDDKLVSTGWLKDNLKKDDLMIVDIRNDIKAYWRGHLPGAVYLHPEALRMSERGVPGKLMSPEILITMLGRMGIDHNITVIIYSERSDFYAAYFLWMLDYLGHERAAILDGGFKKWKRDEGPLSQDYPIIVETGYGQLTKLQDGVRAGASEVFETVKNQDGMIVDVRAEALYNGDEGFWKRKGHIKGAIHHYWEEDLDKNGTWKSKRELEDVYEKLGFKKDDKVIVSCGQGLMSAHTYVTMKYILGYSAIKNYDGGFSEWSNIEKLPVETGMPSQ